MIALWRSHESLRFDALQRAAELNVSENHDRLLQSVDLSTLDSLETWEAENLLALARALGKLRTKPWHEASKLGNILLASPKLRVVSAKDFKSTDFSQIDINREVARNLTKHFASQGDNWQLKAFFAEFQKLWEDGDAALISAFIGYLEGIAQAGNSEVVEQGLVLELAKMCDSEFIEKCRQRAPDADAMEIIHSAVQVIALHALSHDCENAGRVLEFADIKIGQLDDSYHFHQQDVSPLLEPSMAALFELLEAYLTSLDATKVWDLVVKVLDEEGPQNKQLAKTLARLTAKLIGDNAELFAMYFEQLLCFLVRLSPATAAEAAAEFMRVFADNFTTEASRTKLVYTVMNLLTKSQVDACSSPHDFVGALLAVLVAIVEHLGDNVDYVLLAVAVLDQKKGTISPEVDAKIIETWGLLAPRLPQPKFEDLLQQLVKAEHVGDPLIRMAIKTARVSLAQNSGEHSKVLFLHLLDLVIMNTADIPDLIKPLALASEAVGDTGSWGLLNRQRNAWFNLAALGYHANSFEGEDRLYLTRFARHSPPLVSEDSANHVESDLKINAILCRGASAKVLKSQTSLLADRDIRFSASHSTVNLLFMAATLMIEELCCHSGVISRLPHYFADAELSSSGEGNTMMCHFVNLLVAEYTHHWGFVPHHGLTAMASNMKDLIVLSCHRVKAVREIAAGMVTQIGRAIPASLCQDESLYAMFDCLTLLGESDLNAAEDVYSPRTQFVSPHSGITLELGDSLSVRREISSTFEKNVAKWLAFVNKGLSADLRSKLYNYLNLEGALGRGRRCALEFLSSEGVNDDFVAHCILLSRYELSSAGADLEEIINKLHSARNAKELQHAFSLAGPYIAREEGQPLSIIRESVAAPFRIFDEESITSGITFWYHILTHYPKLRNALVCEVINRSALTAEEHRGLFSTENDELQPMWTEMEYAPTNKKVMDRRAGLINRQLAPHSRLLNGFLRSCMYNCVLLSSQFLPFFARLAEVWLTALSRPEGASYHALARNLRLEVISFCIEVLHFLHATKNQGTRMRPANSLYATKIESLVWRAGLGWYVQPTPQWSYGSNLLVQQETITQLQRFAHYLKSTLAKKPSAELKLLYDLVSQEFFKIATWYEPLGRSVDNLTSRASELMSKDADLTAADLTTAWNISPHLAISLVFGWRFEQPGLVTSLLPVLLANPLAVYENPLALPMYLDAFFSQQGSKRRAKSVSHVVLYWHQVSPIQSINFLAPPYSTDHTTLQFALRSLQTHDIAKTFFYVPQIVQQLQYDNDGHIEEFMMETGDYSPKFAHQIIWNMKANMYMDDDATIESPLKPKLDSVLKRMVDSFDGEQREFYETEFKFFGAVTAISGKLKPFIKKSKPEKKAKIDEEIRKIHVPEGVYLPSHPDGVVLDIDRDSGKPLQSHAKAPFLAKFKIRTEIEDYEGLEVRKHTEDVMQGAIFKVGDDCRQDVLALQIISVFRSIFNFSGLDVYVFPYKVTATEAGRGVIDVLPNATSRDMLGREAVNGLDQWYHSKHGGPNSIEFQKARMNFVKSMAAYSVISYLIQFKDRHNGNIMYGDDGHLIHIDFGFCFDISPGGMNFEAAPFKLTKEMVQLMDGPQSVPYRWFEELCVRAFLASRVYADDICRVVQPMIASGLPCFKPQTMRNLRSRFVLHKTEAEAAKHMRHLIKKSFESNYTKVYDEFQRFTNGIPY